MITEWNNYFSYQGHVFIASFEYHLSPTCIHTRRLQSGDTFSLGYSLILGERLKRETKLSLKLIACLSGREDASLLLGVLNIFPNRLAGKRKVAFHETSQVWSLFLQQSETLWKVC